MSIVSRLLRSPIAPSFAALFLAATTVSAAPETPAASSTLEWIENFERFYEANPELKEQGGSGWKPFNRMKWNAERRLTNGDLPRPESILAAWQLRREREGGARGGTGWFQLGPINLSGRITTIEFHPTDPNTVYIGAASGGVWKTTDGGDTYVPVGDQLPSLLVGAVAVLDQDPNVVLIGTGEGAGGASGVGILKSTDAGATWSTTSFSLGLPSGHGFHVIDVNPATGTVLAGATDGLYRSTDQGDTWAQVKAGGQYYDVKFKPGDPSRIYTCRGYGGAAGNNVKVSTDDGLTWVQVGTGQPNGALVGKTKIAVTAADPSVIYANYARSDNAQSLGVYRSTDDGATWTARNTTTNMVNSQGWYNLTIAVDPDDADRVVLGGVHLWESDDGAVTVNSVASVTALGTETDVHWDHHAIAYEPGSTDNVWVGNDGGVWKSTDDGNTWLSRRNGLPTFQFYDICVAQSDPVYMTGGSQDNGFPTKDGSPDSWAISTLIADGMVCNIKPTDADVIYAEWQNGQHVKSNDRAASWFGIMNGLTGSGAWVTPTDQDQNQANHLYTSTTAGIFRTTQGGNPWVNVAPHQAVWISMSPVDGDVVWTVNGTERPWLTTDDGVSWAQTSFYGFGTQSATKIQAHPTEVGTAFVTFGGFSASAKIARTTDFGASWTNVTGDYGGQPANTFIADPADPTAWYLGSDFGVWTSTNGGANWTPFGAGFPTVVVTDLEIQRSARKLVAGTYGRGAWEVNLPSATGVEVAVGVNSSNLMLDPPSPNPVRDQAIVRFAARSEGPVTLEVYDVAGRRVNRIAELPRGDGVVRAASWVAADAPSGVYFVVLRAGAETASTKLIVTR